MSDERAGRPRPDETRQFSPFDEGDDATRIQPPTGPDHPDVSPRSSDPGGLDPTRQMPPVDPATAGAAAWAGRAEVRPPGPRFDTTATEWAVAPPPEPRGRWWMPIVIGIVALVLLALLGGGIWLIIQAKDRNGGTPAPAVTTSVAAPETTEPTTQPTTEVPTTTPPTTEPTNTSVTIPALRGLSRSEAQQALSRRRLSSRLRFVISNDATAGTVIDSDPNEGQQVPPDTTVTLVIAVQPSGRPNASTD
jgi:hypothetical protein